jgi:hypothetical protein
VRQRGNEATRQRGKRQEARGKRQEARGKRQEARGKRQEQEATNEPPKALTSITTVLLLVEITQFLSIPFL